MRVLSFLLGFLCSVSSFATRDTLLTYRVDCDIFEMYDVKMVRHKNWDRLYRTPEHPAFDSLLTRTVEDSLLVLINDRRNMIGDTLTTTEMLWVWKPYFEWLHNEDSHYSMTTLLPFPLPNIDAWISTDNKVLKECEKVRKKQVKTILNKAKIIPLMTLRINDTLVVAASTDNAIKKGDILLSINDIPIQDMLEYEIEQRYNFVHNILMNYHYQCFKQEYTIEFLREGTLRTATIQGQSQKDLTYRLIKQLYSPELQYFDDKKTGYIRIPEFFPINTLLLKNLRKNLISFKDRGYKTAIIDLRGNPGGNGHKIDEFFSIFINAATMPYEKGPSYLKVSEQSKFYNFITDEMMGLRIKMPDKYFFPSIALQQDKFIDGLKYYILMDAGTGSMAAAVCNALQYNNITTVGEPLQRNAYKYGDEIEGRVFLSEKRGAMCLGYLHEPCISITEDDLCTNAINGILYPDIYLPYIAKDYAEGRDGMLEQLVKIIENAQ